VVVSRTTIHPTVSPIRVARRKVASLGIIVDPRMVNPKPRTSKASSIGGAPTMDEMASGLPILPKDARTKSDTRLTKMEQVRAKTTSLAKVPRKLYVLTPTLQLWEETSE